MAELPWVHMYAAEDLHTGRRTPWAIFCSEWDLGAAIALLDAIRIRRALWRFPPAVYRLDPLLWDGQHLLRRRGYQRGDDLSPRGVAGPRGPAHRYGGANASVPAALTVVTVRDEFGSTSRWATGGHASLSPRIYVP